MRTAFLFVFLFISYAVQAHRISRGTKKLVHKIEKCNRLQGAHVGYSGGTPQQYLDFISLRERANTAELLSLLKHKNSVVKGYASWALADNKYPKLYEVLGLFLASEEKVEGQHGCIVSRSDLASEFYYRVYYEKYDNNISKADSLFYVSQIQQMDSVLLYSGKQSYLLDNALENNNANPKTYSRIKELAGERNPDAIVALAKYQKQEDIPFFTKLDKNSFAPIAVFPDKAFWELLVSYKEEKRTLPYFLAVSSYKNDSAVLVLNEIYAGCDSAQLNLLDEALIKNYCVLYQDILLKIWEEHKTIDLYITQKLIVDCPEKSSLAFTKGLLTDQPFNLLELDYNYGTDDKIVPLMLKNISRYNPDSLLSICNHTIDVADFLILEKFLDFIELNKFTGTTDNLFARMSKEKHAYQIYHLTKTLLSFKDPETNKKLTPALIANQVYWDSGNWSISFRKMLRENGIEFQY
jgi:hypothetical protein